eukprot:6214725-Pleurochrysis_carterae.AAC.6
MTVAGEVTSYSREDKGARVEAREGGTAQDSAEGGVAIKEASKTLSKKELLSRRGFLRSDSREQKTLVRQAKDVVWRGAEAVARLTLRRGKPRGAEAEKPLEDPFTAFDYCGQGSTGGCELLRPAMLQIEKEGDERNKIVRGPEGRSKGTASYSKDGGVDQHEHVRGRRVEDSGEGRTVSPRKAASPKKELLALAERFGKAVKIEKLSEDTVDELDAKDSAQAQELHEGRVCAAKHGIKGDEQCNPRVGNSHRLGGDMRGITKRDAGLAKAVWVGTETDGVDEASL